MARAEGTPSATAVSRYMGRRFRRSVRVGRSATQGFTVSEALGYQFRDVDWVVVEHDPGEWMRGLPEGELLKAIQEILVEYQEYLEMRFDVARNDEDGEDQWNCLLVRARRGPRESSDHPSA